MALLGPPYDICLVLLCTRAVDHPMYVELLLISREKYSYIECIPKLPITSTYIVVCTQLLNAPLTIVCTVKIAIEYVICFIEYMSYCHVADIQ